MSKEETKTCNICDLELPLSAFYRKLSGRRSDCIECDKRYLREYRKNNRDKISESNKQWRREHYHRSWALHSRNSHRDRGCIIDISIDDLEKLAVITTHCPICGVELSYAKEKRERVGPLQTSPTTDLKNPKLKIMSKDNIQIICQLCNVTKHIRTMEEFVDYCQMVAQKFGRKTEIYR